MKGYAEKQARAVLLTLGRLPKALELARGFSALGWRVIVADPFAWHLCRVSNAVARSYAVTAPRAGKAAYLRDLLDIVAREGVELIVPVSEESMHVAALDGMLPDGVRLFAKPQETLVGLHDKQNFVRLAASYGLPAPLTHALGDPAGAALAESGDVVVKPVFSCSGSGVSILRRGAALPARQENRAFIVQQFIPGQVFSSFSIAHAGRALATSIYRGTVMQGTVSVAFERVEEQPAITEWLERFVASSGHSGFISFDFIVDPSGRAVAVECNPRVTSGVHFLEPRSVAALIADPETAPQAVFKQKKMFQQFYPCLTQTQGSIFRPEERRRNLHYLRSSRDVVWGEGDWMPLLTMPLTSYRILALSIFTSQTMGEAATRDIEWYEGDT